MLIRNQVKIPYASLLSLLPTHLTVGDSGWLVGLVHRDTCVIPSALSSSMKCSMISFPLAMLSPYCFIASFSMLLSKPKKNLMSTLAFCSKHVQSEFSGWTWKPIINFSNFTLKIYYMAPCFENNLFWFEQNIWSIIWSYIIWVSKQWTLHNQRRYTFKYILFLALLLGNAGGGRITVVIHLLDITVQLFANNVTFYCLIVILKVV